MTLSSTAFTNGSPLPAANVYNAFYLLRAGRGGHLLASAELVALNSGSLPPWN